VADLPVRAPLPAAALLDLARLRRRVRIVYLTADGAPVDDATYASTFINSSFTVAMNTVIGCLVWLLVAAPVAGEAAARDASTRMHPLTYTTPVRKRDHLGGRFLAAFLLNATILLGVTVGILLAAYRPGVPDQYVGPLRVAAFLYPYLFIALPNVFLTTSVQFALAALGRRPMAAYLGSVLVFFVAYVVGLIVAFALRDPELSKLLDPIGPFFIFGELPAGWTPVEKNTRLLTLDGGLLHNRLIWTGVGIGTLALTYARFRFGHHVAGRAWPRLLRRQAPTAPPRPAPATPVAAGRPSAAAARSFDVAAGLRQTVAIAGVSFRTLARMRGGLDVLLVIAVLIVVVQPLNLEIAGVPIVARMERVLRDLATPLTNFATPFALVPLLVVYWAGELVWRERDAGLGEITDAAPVRHWAMVVGKLLGLALMLAAFMALLALAGILVQLRVGAADVEVGRYLQILFGFQLTEYLLFAVLAFVVHVLANQKYAGHLVASCSTASSRCRRSSGSSTGCWSTGRAHPGRTRRCAASARRSARGCGSSCTGPRGPCCSPSAASCCGRAGGRAGPARACAPPAPASPRGWRRSRHRRRRSCSAWAAPSSTTRTSDTATSPRTRTGGSARSTSGATPGTSARRSRASRRRACAWSSTPSAAPPRCAGRTSW
jgi:ABC-type transport system involved in multi-copper enzyme maturation permease subunit